MCSELAQKSPRAGELEAAWQAGASEEVCEGVRGAGRRGARLEKDAGQVII